MRSFAPSPLLAPFVSDLLVVEVVEAVARLRVPEPGLVLGVRFRGAAVLDDVGLLPEVSLAGMASTARTMTTSAGGGVVLARFRPGGAQRFFAMPLHHLFGATVSLHDVMPRDEVERVHEQVRAATTDAARVHALEALLLARLHVGPVDRMVRAAVDAIAQAPSDVRVGELARALGLSRDRLEKRFRAAVGATPKELARVFRLRAAIDAHAPGVPLAQLALEAGFADQAHFARETRAMTGMAPGALFRSPLLQR
jgi:methylphosphotriester-DNA--protein-cysteine methyltransferase